MSSTLMSVRAAAMPWIHFAGFSLKRVARVVQMMTAIFGLAISRHGSLIRHRKLANALARRRKDRIGQRRCGRRGSGLADPSRSLAALHDVNLDCRRLVHPQHLVVVEIALLDTTALQRDLATQRRRDAEDDPA